MAMTLDDIARKYIDDAADSEQVVIGAMLLHHDSLGLALSHLSHDDFQHPANRTTFSIVASLHEEHSGKIDATVVRSRLERDGLLERVGGATYLIEAMERVMSPTIDYHIKQIRNAARLVKMCYTVDRVIRRMGESHESADAQVQDAISELMTLADGSTSSDKCQSVADVVADVYAEIILQSDSGARLRGVSTGVPSLDDLLICMEPGTLNIIGARPSVGKTAFGFQVAEAAASCDESWAVDWHSLEMTSRLMGYRMLAQRSGVSLHRLRTGKLHPDIDRQPLMDAADSLSLLDININVSPKLTIPRFELAAKRAMALGRKVFFIDHLHLMGTPPKIQSRNEALGYITSSLKAFAQENEAIVVLLCQLRRLDSPTRAPRLDDLRDSGNIEQDADNVIFVHRPGMADRMSSPTDDDEECQLILAKNRQGPVGVAKVLFQPEKVRFIDAEARRYARSNN